MFIKEASCIGLPAEPFQCNGTVESLRFNIIPLFFLDSSDHQQADVNVFIFEQKNVEIIYSKAHRAVVLLQTVVLFVVDVFSIRFLLVVLSD